MEIPPRRIVAQMAECSPSPRYPSPAPAPARAPGAAPAPAPARAPGGARQRFLAREDRVILLLAACLDCCCGIYEHAGVIGVHTHDVCVM